MRSLKNIKATEFLEFRPDGAIADALEFHPDAGPAGFRRDGTTAILIEPRLFRRKGIVESIFPFHVQGGGTITSDQSIVWDAKGIFS